MPSGDSLRNNPEAKFVGVPSKKVAPKATQVLQTKLAPKAYLGWRFPKKRSMPGDSLRSNPKAKFPLIKKHAF